MALLLPGLAAEPAVLLQERTRPDFRDVFGWLCSTSTSVAVAVTRVRLTTLNLTPEELANVQSLRVLVSEVSAIRLTAEARGLSADPQRGLRLDMLKGLLESGVLEVRAAPLAGWAPDFTVFSPTEGTSAVLTGFHWFERPYPNRGPALAALHFGRAAHLAGKRHSELWEAAHDVGPAVWNILAKARSAPSVRALTRG